MGGGGEGQAFVALRSRKHSSEVLAQIQAQKDSKLPPPQETRSVGFKAVCPLNNKSETPENFFAVQVYY